MKKYNLFKILGIVILVYFLLTWIISASYYSGGLQELGKYQMSIPMLWQLPIQTLGYFSSTFLFILAVGGFYGVLEITGVYRKVLDKLADKASKHKLVWLLVIMFAVAAISSVVGLELGMFLFFPFLISLIILMGYDKFTALLATLGATIVGMFGATFAYTSYGITDSLLKTKITDGMLIKVILFVLGFGLLVLFTLLHLKKSNKKIKLNKDKVKEKAKSKIAEKAEKVEVALEKFIPITKEEKKKDKKKLWPLIVVISVLLVIFVLSTLNWSDAFGVTWFKTSYTKVMEYTVKDFAIFSKLFSGVKELGTLAGPTKFLYYTSLIFISTVVLAVVYRVKFNDYVKALADGAKEYVKTAFLVIFAYAVLVIVSSYPIFLTVAKTLVGDQFNVATTGMATMLGSGLYVDMYYYPQYVLQYFGGLENADANILNVLFVSLYSAVMLVAPTSTLLLATLDTFETSYKDWMKFIWKLFLALVVVAFVVLAIFSVI